MVPQAPTAFENAHPHLINKLQGFGDHYITHTGDPNYHGHIHHDPSAQLHYPPEVPQAWSDAQLHQVHMNQQPHAQTLSPTPPTFYYNHPAQPIVHDPTQGHGYKPPEHAQAVNMSDTWISFMSDMNIPTAQPHAKR